MPNSPLSDKTIRVSIPASVASNIDSLKQSLESVNKKLGCPECCSGFDIQFQMERDLMVDENLEITPINFSTPLKVPSVSVKLPGSAGFDIEKVKKTLEGVSQRIGCPQCCSGLDITFKSELNLDFSVDNDGKLI